MTVLILLLSATLLTRKNNKVRNIIYIYIATTIAYFLLGNGSIYWSAFNMVTILAFIIALLNMDVKRSIWTEFATNMTLGRIVYSLACTVAPYEWIYTINKLFAITFLAWAIILRIREKALNGGLK